MIPSPFVQDTVSGPPVQTETFPYVIPSPPERARYLATGIQGVPLIVIPAEAGIHEQCFILRVKLRSLWPVMSFSLSALVTTRTQRSISNT
jgi:hypothetical protein